MASRLELEKLWTPGQPVERVYDYKWTYPKLDLRNPPQLEDILWGNDYRWWFELFVKIQPQGRPVEQMHLWPWMQEVSYNGLSNRELMLKARENGSSTFWVNATVRDMLVRPGANFIIAADKEENAVNLIKIAKTCVQHLPEGISPGIVADNQTTLSFGNPINSSIIGLTSTPKSGRSHRGLYVLATELAFWEAPETTWVSVTGTGVKGDRYMGESTANTAADMFHDMWYDDTNKYRKHFYGRQCNPNHDEEWWEQKQRDIKDPHLRKRDYPNHPDDAFLTSSDTYFSADIITEGSASARPPQVEKDLGGRGWVRIWKYPVANRVYIIAADTATGAVNRRKRPDWSDAKVLDWLTGEHVATIHCNIPYDEFADVLAEVGKMYNSALLAVESNSPSGLAVLERLKATLQYPKLFYRRVAKGTLQGSVTDERRELGWVTSHGNRGVILSNMYNQMREGSFVCYDQVFWDQCKSFMSEDGGKASPDSHDDSVLSMAIALRVRQEYQPGREIDPSIWETVRDNNTKSSWTKMW